MVPCLLVIAIGGIRAEILLNAFIQIETHGFRVRDPETANAVPLARNPIFARGSAERFQKILAGNRHNALLFAPRLGELKALRLVALAHTDCKHLRLDIQQAQHIGGITQIFQHLLAEGDTALVEVHIRVSVDVGVNRFKIQRRKIKILLFRKGQEYLHMEHGDFDIQKEFSFRLFCFPL